MNTAKLAEATLCEELPYWNFFDEALPHAVLTDGSLVAGLKVGLLDIECMDASGINRVTEALRSALNSVSEKTSLQFVFSVGSDFEDKLRAHEEGISLNAPEFIRKMAEHRLKALRVEQSEAMLYRPELLLFLRVSSLAEKKRGILKGLFGKEEAFCGETEAAYLDTLEVLTQNIESLSSSLGAAGIKTRTASKTEIVSSIYRFLNPKRSKSEPLPVLPNNATGMELENDTILENPWLAEHSPRERLSFGDLVLNYQGFVLDSFEHRLITLKTLPEITFAGMLSNFLRMPFHYELILSVEVPPQAGEMAKLNQKRRMAHSLAVTHGNKVSDLESESKLSSTEELIRELLNSGQRIYAVQMSLVLKAPVGVEGTKTLNRRVREVLARFRSLNGAEGLEESVGSWKIVKGSLPAAPIRLERARKMKTNNLADFLPVYGPEEGDRDPSVLFKNRLGGVLSFNPFDAALSNFNSLVTGASGAGKSVLNNFILMQEATRKVRTYIIDIGGSYRKLTEALGGQYLDVDLSDKYRINPFHLRDPKQEPSAQKIKSLLAVLECMMTDEGAARLTKLDRALLEKALVDLYAEKRIQAKVPTLSDLTLYLEKSDEVGLRSFAKLLYGWTGDRSYGRILDGHGSLRTDALICTFDLKGLSNYPDLQSVMILILTDFILSQIEGDRLFRNRIILDEAWQSLKIPAAATFMEYCVRTARKIGLGSGITFITQGVEEIVTSPIGSAIIGNTATKFVMLQRGDSDILRDTLKLNDQELALIYSLEQRKGHFSEGFMIKGDTRQVIRIHPQPLEYWLSTSDGADNQYLETLIGSEGLSLMAALEKAASIYPWGIAAGIRKAA